jgi:hypothetical protein
VRAEVLGRVIDVPAALVLPREDQVQKRDDDDQQRAGALEHGYGPDAPPQDQGEGRADDHAGPQAEQEAEQGRGRDPRPGGGAG